MKASVKQMVEAYAILGKAKVTKLEEEEIGKILDARKAMRPVDAEYKSFEEDAHEKFKVEGLEDAEKTRQEVIAKFKEDNTYKPTESEIEAINKVNDYFVKVTNAKAKELEREVELKIESLKKESYSKLMKENGLSVEEIEIIQSIM